MNSSNYKTDCMHFNGFKPCFQHKSFRTECGNCSAYQSIAFRILIIKTGAAGDVIRSTPILRRLRKIYPKAEITWITLYPDFLPKDGVDKILYFSWENCLSLFGQKFNLVISLDKSLPETTLVSRVTYDECWGFVSDQNGRVLPANLNALNKWETGINDTKMLKNEKHFIEEIFEICGWNFEGEKYWIAHPEPSLNLNLKNSSRKKVVGLNTGCGDRWITRLWPIENFVELSELLLKKGYIVVLLGGADEDERNKEISNKTGALYFGVKPLMQFVELVSQCDIIMSSVTMALHISIALEKRIILLNNIFPTKEFHLYGLGKILEPNISCQYCFKGVFDSNCQQQNCLKLIDANKVFNEIEGQLFEKEF